MLKTIGRTLAVTLLPQTTERFYARAEAKGLKAKGLRLTLKEIDRASVSKKNTLTFDLLTLAPRILVGNKEFRAVGIGKVDPKAGPHFSSLASKPIPGLYSLVRSAVGLPAVTVLMASCVVLASAIGAAVGLLAVAPAAAAGLLGRPLYPLLAGLATYNKVLDGCFPVCEGLFTVLDAPSTLVRTLSGRLSKKLYGEAKLEGFDLSGDLYRDTTAKLGKPRVTKKVRFELPVQGATTQAA